MSATFVARFDSECNECDGGQVVCERCLPDDDDVDGWWMG